MILLIYIVMIFLFVVGIIFLRNYRRKILDVNSDSYNNMKSYPMMMSYMKKGIPIVIGGFIMNVIFLLFNIYLHVVA